MAKKNELNSAVELSVQAREKDRKGLIKKFMEEPKVQVSVSPLYQPYFGRVMMVSIQGISVHVPANGKTYAIPKSFAGDLLHSIALIDSKIKREQRMSDVSRNFEGHAGELRF